MEVIGAQGEITIIRVDALPNKKRMKKVKSENGRHIISHSENGHHHVLTRGEVFEDLAPPTGMKVLYALLDEPAELVQDAPVPHGKYSLPAGTYQFRIAREYDPFDEAMRQVID